MLYRKPKTPKPATLHKLYTHHYSQKAKNTGTKTVFMLKASPVPSMNPLETVMTLEQGPLKHHPVEARVKNAAEGHKTNNGRLLNSNPL